MSLVAHRRMPAARTERWKPNALPAWPLAILLGAYPLWWALGAADFAWIIFGAVMLLYLGRAEAVRVPRGFGIWLSFIAWMVLTATQVDTAARLLGFSYRALIYLAGTIIFVYVYNARKRLTERLILGALTLFWVFTVLGGYLGLLFPTTVIRTPLGSLLPGALLNNELVHQMVVRRLAQYNPDGWFEVPPRPSAPFLYTNNWGNVYSLLLPFVILYLIRSRGERRFWLILALLPASLVPAVATMNRGMFLGLGVAAVYLAFRYLLLGKPKALLAIMVGGIIGVGIVSQTAVGDGLEARVENTSTTEDRWEVYMQTIAAVEESPLLGMGAPRPSPTDPDLPPVGTHGQFWIVLHSHGVPGMLLFMGWLAAAFTLSLKRRDTIGLVANAGILVAILETFYYGLLPTGLMMVMIVAALALRPSDSETARVRVADALRTGAPQRSTR